MLENHNKQGYPCLYAALLTTGSLGREAKPPLHPSINRDRGKPLTRE